LLLRAGFRAAAAPTVEIRRFFCYDTNMAAEIRHIRRFDRLMPSAGRAANHGHAQAGFQGSRMIVAASPLFGRA
jgi:hypothetical protein